MSKPQFEELRERLLRAGIAPSHVHRYLRELRDHYDDLYRAECARGLQPSAAAQTARTRLGSDELNGSEPHAADKRWFLEHTAELRSRLANTARSTQDRRAQRMLETR